MIVAWHRPGRDELLLVRSVVRRSALLSPEVSDEQELVPTGTVPGYDHSSPSGTMR